MKIHLVHSAEPIVQGGTIQAACGRPVANAQAIYMVDYQQCDIAYSVSNMCRKCANVDERKRYVYGIAAGEEVMEERAHA